MNKLSEIRLGNEELLVLMTIANAGDVRTGLAFYRILKQESLGPMRYPTNIRSIPKQADFYNKLNLLKKYGLVKQVAFEENGKTKWGFRLTERGVEKYIHWQHEHVPTTPIFLCKNPSIDIVTFAIEIESKARDSVEYPLLVIHAGNYQDLLDELELQAPSCVRKMSLGSKSRMSCFRYKSGRSRAAYFFLNDRSFEEVEEVIMEIFSLEQPIRTLGQEIVSFEVYLVSCDIQLSEIEKFFTLIKKYISTKFGEDNSFYMEVQHNDGSLLIYERNGSFIYFPNRHVPSIGSKKPDNFSVLYCDSKNLLLIDWLYKIVRCYRILHLMPYEFEVLMYPLSWFKDSSDSYWGQLGQRMQYLLDTRAS